MKPPHTVSEGRAIKKFMLSRLLHSATKWHKAPTIHSTEHSRQGAKVLQKSRFCCKHFSFHLSPKPLSPGEYYSTVRGDWLSPDNVFSACLLMSRTLSCCISIAPLQRWKRIKAYSQPFLKKKRKKQPTQNIHVWRLFYFKVSCVILVSVDSSTQLFTNLKGDFYLTLFCFC